MNGFDPTEPRSTDRKPDGRNRSIEPLDHVEAETTNWVRAFRRAGNPYNDFMADLGVSDGGPGKVDQLYANAYELANITRGEIQWMLHHLNVIDHPLEDVEGPYDTPVTYEDAFRLMQTAVDEGYLITTDSKRYVYHHETNVVRE